MKRDRLRPRLPRHIAEIGAFAGAHLGGLPHHRHALACRDVVLVREQQRHIRRRAGDEEGQHIRLRAEVEREECAIVARRHTDADFAIAGVE